MGTVYFQGIRYRAQNESIISRRGYFPCEWERNRQQESHQNVENDGSSRRLALSHRWRLRHNKRCVNSKVRTCSEPDLQDDHFH